MDIVELIKDFALKHNMHPVVPILSYPEYIAAELGPLSTASNECYDAEDQISILGWVTTQLGTQYLAYSTLRFNMVHGALISFENGTLTKQHTHNYIELAYIVEGHLTQHILGTAELFKKGEICLIGKNSEHTDSLFWENSAVVFLGIDSEFFNQYLQSGKFNSDADYFVRQLIARKRDKFDFVRFSPKENAIQTKRTFESILDEFFDVRPYRVSIIRSYVERLLLLISDEYNFVLTANEKQEFESILFKDIDRYVITNFRTVSVNELASYFRYSSDYLSKLCFQQTGLPLSKYIISIRMKEALELILSTNNPIEEIADAVGYNNLGFFYKKFKEIYHTTPHKLRSQKV